MTTPTSLGCAVVAIVIGLALAGAIGWLLTRRAGVLRKVPDPGSGDPGLPELSRLLGLVDGKPAIVHFSAPWCGPCSGVRRVVDQVCAELDGVTHIEIDTDTNPAAATSLSVLSLPTTFIFDAAGRQRFRATGVPSATALRAALEPLLA